MFLAVSQELLDARDELHDWTTKLVDLKSVMDSIDEEDEDIDLDDEVLENDTKDQKPGLLESIVRKNEEAPQSSREMTTAVDLLKDLQDLSEQLLADVQDDEINLSIMDD